MRLRLRLLLLSALHLASLALFSRGYLLTRVHLTQTAGPTASGPAADTGGSDSAAAGGSAAEQPPPAHNATQQQQHHHHQRGLLSQPPYRKLVWVMVDALRYDMVVADGRYACLPGAICHQQRMAYLSRLLADQVGAGGGGGGAGVPPAAHG